MNDINQLRSILSAFIGSYRDLIASGEDLSDEEYEAAYRLLELILSRIDQAEQQEPVESMPPSTPQEPDLEEGGPSSNIESFGYDDKTGRLLVRFLGKHPNREGPIYAYGGVPKQIFDLFQRGAIPARTDGRNKWGRWWKGKVPSLGASMYTLIKGGNYPYQRLG